MSKQDLKETRDALHPGYVRWDQQGGYGPYFACKTIAEFPITDPANMDAWNIQAIARHALKDAIEPSGIANKAAEEGELPALPEPMFKSVVNGGMLVRDGYDSLQVFEYARQAIAADRATRPSAGNLPKDLAIQLLNVLNSCQGPLRDIASAKSALEAFIIGGGCNSTAHTAGASEAIWTAITRLERLDSSQEDRFAAANELRFLAATNTAGAVLEGWKQQIEAAMKAELGIGSYHQNYDGNKLASALRTMLAAAPSAPAPTQAVKEVPSIDTPEFRDLLLGSHMARDGDDAGRVGLKLIAHIDAHVARHAQAAPQADFLLPDDMEALARFYECAEDFDSGGHDVPKETMRRLVEIGVVRPAGPGRHMATSFGDHVMGRDAQLGLALPLKTLDERNQELALRSNQEKGGAQ